MGTFVDFVDVAKQAVRHHGGVSMVFRRLWQVLAFEGLSGLKKKVRQLLANRKTFSSSHESDGTVRLDTANNSEKKSESRMAVLSPGALLLGHPFGVLGMGEHIRLSASAFSAAEIPFRIRNIYGEYGLHLAEIHQDFPFRDKVAQNGFYRANVFHINADEMMNAQIHLGKDVFTDRYNIGYWAWELSRFPNAWRPSLQLVDEVWAPSRFIEQAIADATSSPVIRMPLAVEFPEPNGMTRKSFGLPDDRFLFLFFFDFTSYVQRKNPEGAIRAFLQAFPDGDDARVGIVIKMNGMDLRPQEYQAFIQSIDCEDPRIILMDKVLTDRETKSLVKLCDCFLSLHRSEGFGRGLAEAMYLGKPVIATGYSGNLDFTNAHNSCLVDYRLIPVGEHEYPFAKGQKWADPDIEHAVWFMKRVVNEPNYAQTIGQHAADFIKTHHSSQAVGSKYRGRLLALNLLDEL
ncbi:glycosyltransferase [Nitrospira sp. T9]|uniref:glycosyltransferase n=1 Tax=unclassified Nitrospira TaxID=2652172 RepID=UPI003F94EB02